MLARAIQSCCTLISQREVFKTWLENIARVYCWKSTVIHSFNNHSSLKRSLAAILNTSCSLSCHTDMMKLVVAFRRADDHLVTIQCLNVVKILITENILPNNANSLCSLWTWWVNVFLHGIVNSWSWQLIIFNCLQNCFYSNYNHRC